MPAVFDLFKTLSFSTTTAFWLSKNVHNVIRWLWEEKKNISSPLSCANADWLFVVLHFNTLSWVFKPIRVSWIPTNCPDKVFPSWSALVITVKHLPRFFLSSHLQFIFVFWHWDAQRRSKSTGRDQICKHQTDFNEGNIERYIDAF